MEDDFLFYPEFEDESFYEDIYSKKEFRRNKIDPETYYSQSMEDLCGSGQKMVQEKILQPHQEFLRNYISNETPYNGILLFHGVGTGKCISPSTLVYANGRLISIEELWNKYNHEIVEDNADGCNSEWASTKSPIWINAYDEISKKILEEPVKRLYRQKVCEKLVVIELENNQIIKLTHNHHLLTENGWSNDFVNNKYISVPKVLKNTQNIQSLGESGLDLSYFMGWYVSKRIIKTSPGVIFIRDKSPSVLRMLENRLYNICRSSSYMISSRLIEGYLRVTSHDLVSQLSKDIDKYLDMIMAAPLNEVRAFLQAYFDAEAYVSIKSRCIRLRFHSVLLTKIHQLLKLFGINLWVSVTKKRKVYRASLKGQNIKLFKDHIGFCSYTKAQRLHVISDFSEMNSIYNHIAEDDDDMSENRKFIPFNTTRASGSRDKILVDSANNNNNNNSNNSNNSNNNDLELLKIKSVTLEDYEGWVYDLEVDKYHNYIAGGILCHNTCAAISIAESLKPRLKALNKKVYILTPGQTKSNFEKELYDMRAEGAEREAGLEPGSYQCTGMTYYIPPKEGVDEGRREARIARQAYGSKSIYEFFGQQTSFPTFVEFDTKNPEELFSDSVIIVDEAHNLSSTKKAGKDVDEKEKKYGERGPTPNKNAIQTLTDLFSGYHAFKIDWIANNQALKKEQTQLRNKLEGGKRSKATITKTLMKEAEIKATAAWGKLSDEEKKKWQKRAPKNVKLILMTASPMENSPEEIVGLLNLLRMNDRRPLIESNKLFHNLSDPNIPVQDKVNKSYLCRMAKGYISYVRGQNPITFPIVLDPPEDQLYNPGYVNPAHPEPPIPLYTIDGSELIEGKDVKLRLVKVPMSPLQYSTHSDWVAKSKANQEFGKGGERAFKLAQPGLQISNMILPTGDPMTAVYGNAGFDSVFKLIKRDRVAVGTTKTGSTISRQPAIQYAYNESLGLEGLRAFIRDEPAVKGLEAPVGGQPFGQLATYSPKFDQIITNMQDPNKWGINFAYSEFVSSGALLLGIVLELNGYVKFKLPPNEKTANFQPGPNGKYSPNTYDSLVNDSIYDKLKLKRRYRCYKCAKLDGDPIHNMSDSNKDPLKHAFKQGTYILFTGGHEKQRELENKAINQPSNRYGEIIKIMLGSHVAGEGVNLYNCRQVHILDPWHHNTRIYQAMGRAIRHCSHKNLPPDQRNVTVYKYSATVPEILNDQRRALEVIMKAQQPLNVPVINLESDFTSEATNTLQIMPELIEDLTLEDLVTETADESVYFRVLRKDVIIKYTERIMKEIAIDCAFFKAVNVFPQDKFPAEVDGSRICDYLPCNYQCIWGCGPPVKYWDPDAEYPINTDTYNKFFSKTQVDRVVRYIQRIFTTNWSLNLQDIVKLVHQKDPTIELEYIYQALDKMIQPAQDQPIVLDRYKREGNLIYAGKYYIVQPRDFVRTDIPTYYRQMPIKVTAKARNIERLKSSEVATEADTTLDIVELDKLINILLNDANNAVRSKGVVSVEGRLDRLPADELQYIYEKVYTQNGKTNLADMMVEYLRKRKLILETPTLFGHMIRDARQYISDSNIFGNAPPKKVNEAKMISDAEDSMKLDVLYDPADDFDLGYKFYGYYDNRDGSFKLVDLSSERTKLTKDKKISVKTHVPGRNCVNYTKGQLENVVNTLSQVPGLFTDTERNNLVQSGTKETLCGRIETALRLLNERDEDRIWYLYPNEANCVEYDTEGRHLLKGKCD